MSQADAPDAHGESASTKPEKLTSEMWKDSLALAQQDFQLLKNLQDERLAIAGRVRGRIYIVSLATAAVVHLGAIPTKFEVLGIEFSQAQQAAFPLFMGLAAAYLAARFYFAEQSADHYGKQIAFQWGYLHGMSEEVVGRRALPKMQNGEGKPSKKGKPKPRFRISADEFLERRVPVLAGCYAAVISTVPMFQQLLPEIISMTAGAQ